MNLEVPFDPEYLKIIEHFIQDKLKDSFTDGVVLGLSGGLDSCVVLKICSRVIAKDKITPIFLPETTTPKSDQNDAYLLSKELGISLLEIPINVCIKSYLDINEIPKPTDLALGNLKARVRMNVIYLIANSLNRLVMGTSNKSELLLGYFTKHGDGASDIAPIGDLYKTQVRALAEYIKLPAELITKPPTAGLVMDQTDEGELGLDYKTIDMILYGLERNFSTSKIAEQLKLDTNIIDDLKDRVEKNRHKRKFSKIPKIGIKTIGVDLYE